MVKNEGKTASVPPQFAIHQTDPTSILIEAILPTDKPAAFEDLYDVYSKKETGDDQWAKVTPFFPSNFSIVSFILTDRNNR